MLSRNNKNEMMQRCQNQKPHFALRKLSFGVASVLIGLTFYGVSGSAHAATTDAVNADQDTSAPQQATTQSTSNTVALQSSENTNSSSQATAPTTQKYTSVEGISVYRPGNDGGAFPDYQANVAMHTIEKDSASSDQWSSATFDSQNLNDLLKGHNFIKDGYSGYQLHLTKATARLLRLLLPSRIVNMMRHRKV